MLKTYYSNRLENLSEKLAVILSEAPSDPFESEHVVVQNSGLARWLALQLADRMGVCANYEFRHPSEFQWFLLRCVLDRVPEVSEFSPTVLRWRIHGLMPQLARESCFAPITDYLEERGGKSAYHLSCRLADVFDRYLTYRPDWIRDWERGGGDDWQAELWRRVTGPSSQLHRIDLLDALSEKLSRAAATGETVSGLPERVCVFGTPTLAPAAMDIMAKLAELSDVHLFLMNPCREYWGQISSPREVARQCRERDPAESYVETGNPLLAAFGRQGRAFLDSVLEYPAEEYDCYEEPGARCLLHALQSHILNLEEPDGTQRRPVEEHDRSLQIHSCHSIMREVQVLRDQLLSIFEESPDLTPSDIVVMTPDIERYSASIDAVFSAETKPKIPYNLADRNPTAEGRIARAFMGILDLPDSRFEATRILALLDVRAIRDRFGIERKDLEQIQRWVKDAGIRWGVDAEDRSALGFPAGEEHTWRTGLDRLLLGYALPSENGRLFRNLLPHETVEGESALALGRFLSFAEQMIESSRELSKSRTPLQWSRVLLELLDTVFQVSDDEESQLRDLRESVQKLALHCEIADFREPVTLEIVRAHFQLELRSAVSSGQFLSGGVTFCTLLPMRSVPFAVVCLLGMNQSTFPRQGAQPSFDLTARDYRPGDRSKREDDRYLFLEALTSARRYFYVSYVGQDQRDNATLSPSVLVSELLSSIENGFCDAADPMADILGKVTTQHPLQPFSPSYFADGGRLFSYSKSLADATQALVGSSRHPGPAFFEDDLPPTEELVETVDLDRLVRFLGHPSRFLLQQRMRIRLVEGEDLLSDQEPLVLEGLGIYRLRKALLDLALSGRHPEDCEAIVRSAGLLPHGRAGSLFLREEGCFVSRFARRLELAGFRDAGVPVPVDVEVGGIRLVGSLKNVTPGGLVEHRLGRSTGRDWLSLWTRHLVLCCVRPSGNWSSCWIGEDKQIRLRRVDHPEEHLEQLLRHYGIGQNRPLHLFSKTSLTYAQKSRDPQFRGDPFKAARRTWTGGEFSWGESNDRYHEVAFRGRDPLDEDFRKCALSIYDPIFAHETRDSPPEWLQ